ncbi:MAG: DASS family sodium-coupled anion symporter [Opitutaceae bacterium]|nr:DASS family sodium-coupled anion symporter [Opitutaceae bacterium]
MEQSEATGAGAGESGLSRGLRQKLGLLIGPAALLSTLFLPAPAGLSAAGWHTAGVGALLAVFWICESIPIPATALLPLVLFPALQLGDIRETATPYAHPIVFLFLGGFIIALAMQRCNLHRRIAINLMGAMGTQPKRIIAGFLLASALLSMWVSNTATAMMMLPIALSVTQLIPAGSKGAHGFTTALVLSVAYGATTGGMGTLIGTPPNALLAAYLGKVYETDIGFGQWMLLGVPVVMVTLPIVYLILTRVSFKLPAGELPGFRDLLEREKTGMGRFSREEKIVSAVFSLTALGWITQPWLVRVVPLITDTSIGLIGALLLFFIPVRARRGEFVMDWATANRLPWEVLLLFGGGLSLAGNIERHGLSRFLGDMCNGLQGAPMLLTLGFICFGILLLTELTSNTATAATFLPIAGAIALSFGQNPLLFLIPVALAANCSYMMPVGTPPNAIVFGSGMVTLPQMVKAGIWMNVLLVPIIIGLVMLLGPWAFGIQMDLIPAWAK